MTQSGALRSRRLYPIKPGPSSHPREARISRCLALGWALTLVQALVLFTPPAPAAAAAPEGRPAESADPVRLVAPEPVRAFLLRHMALFRYLAVPDLSRGERERLLALAPDDIRRLLATQGYFGPTIHISTPEAPVPDPDRVRLEVDPGPQAVVDSLDLVVQGDAPRQQALVAAWSLRPGEPFTQAAWDEAKERARRQLAREVHPFARLQDSRAEVDPVQHRVALRLHFETGPAVRFGDLQLEGAQRYEADMARRLVRMAGLREGLAYDEALLQRAQRQLLDSGYYDSAFVVMAEQGQAAAWPVSVQLREAPRQRWLVGLGLTTTTGPRLSLEHLHHRVPGLDRRSLLRLNLERETAQMAAEFTSPVDERGWRALQGVQVQRLVDGPAVTWGQQWRAGRTLSTAGLDRGLVVQLDHSARTMADSVGGSVGGSVRETQTAISGVFTWTQRRFDSLQSPLQGDGLAAELGAGATLGDRSQPYARLRARWLHISPLGASVAGGPRSRLALRLEAGAIWADDASAVPVTQRFRAGGDQSVRGYGPREIGVRRADGAVDAGRYLLAASLEWQQPLSTGGDDRPLEAVLFADGAAVADALADLRLLSGVGMGLRYRSPVGPLQLSLAYAPERRQVRLHLGVGFAF